MKNLLVFCSTRIRPDRVLEMLKSFDETHSEGTDIKLYISEDDPRLSEYSDVIKTRDCTVGPYKNIVQVDNYYCQTFPEYKYYAHIDDDYLLYSKKWDTTLINDIETKGKGWGMAFGRDIRASGSTEFPIFPILSGNIIKTLGYFIHPIFEHNYADGYLKDIGNAIGYFFNPDVIIEHRHYPHDDNYAYTAKQCNAGYEQYCEWKTKFKESDLAKLRKAMK